MTTIIYKEQKYIKEDYIFTNAPIYVKECSNGRELIRKKNLDETQYIFAKNNNDKWIITKGTSYKFDKLFFNVTLIDTIPELNKTSDIITDDNGIEKAPLIIHLDEHEKFKDDDNNILDIETRGEREHDKIFFKVKDVAKCFNMENLYSNIITNITSYAEFIDYKYFISEKEQILQKKNIKETVKKELFLTYHGLLRVLFVSRNNKTNKFINWATKTLFTVQMGTIEQKNKLVSKIKGVSYDTIQELFSINARDLPCVYLTAFNVVGILREKMNIDESYNDSDIVYKFGLTKSFELRKNNHKVEYKEIADLIDMKLVYFTYIDPLYISEAENEIKTLLSDYKIHYLEHNELAIISNSTLKFVKTLYENLGMKYSGHAAEFNKQIFELNSKIEQFKNNETIYKLEYDNLNLKYKFQIESLHKDYITTIANKDIDLANKDNEIERLKKDLEILSLKHQIQMMESEKTIKK